ncbi:Na/Pi cotransporter family protein [Nanoarchaeota archaeon]
MKEIVFGLFGGLGIFIYGMILMSESLQKVSRDKLKKILSNLTSNRFKGVFVGTVMTSIIQSSSVTSVILIGFLNAGLMNLTQGLAVMFGANIGTTITAQLIAFKITDYAWLLVGIGAFTYFYFDNNKHRSLGLVILGFGLIFIGLNTMKSVVAPLKEIGVIDHFFVQFSRNPLLAIFVGMVATAVLQSSSVTIGITLALASSGLINLPASIFILIGGNIGTCVTAVIASIGGKSSAKKLALGHTLFNVLGAGIAFLMLPIYLYFIPLISSDISRQIANTHTLFNIVNTLIFIGFISLFAKLLNKIIKAKENKREDGEYLDRNLLKTPPFAIKAAVKELSRMLNITKEMFGDSNVLFKRYNYKTQKKIVTDEESVDLAQKEITEYLVEITRKQLDDKDSNLIPSLIHTVNDIERVGDHCENLVKFAENKHENNAKFSEKAVKEIDKINILINELFELSYKAMIEENKVAARKGISIKNDIKLLLQQFRMKHIERMKKGLCLSEPGLIYTDILSSYELICGHLANINESVADNGRR